MTSNSIRNSQALMTRAQQTIPGGVNSPVRAFKGVGGTPLFFTHGEGAYLTDADNNRYIDYVGSWGPMILGHGNKAVVQAIQEQAAKAIGFGAPTELEIDLAETVTARVPSIEKVRMVNSGTEATMSAIRLARGFTGRDMIVKFSGCYHGHSDALLVKAGSGLLTLGIPNSAGVPEAVAAQTLTLPFNELEPLAQAFANYKDQIACVIVEPVAGNMGCIPPSDDFLPGLRELTKSNGAVLIFDEVMTGFRVAEGGAQQHYNVQPDLTTLGKVIGGGMPVGAFGGRADIMSHIAPEGNVYQAGTLSGNPLAVAAGLRTLNQLDAAFYNQLEQNTQYLADGIRQLLKRHNITGTVHNVCGMFGLFFDVTDVTCFEHVANSNVDRFNQFFHKLLNEGVYLAPSAFETGFISGAHDQSVLDATLAAMDKVLPTLN